MALFGTIFYGGGDFYGPGNLDIPIDLRFYRTNTDNVYVFHWTFQEGFFTPLLATFDFELQLDTDQTFTSPNLTTFLSGDVITFQNGDVRKGYAVPVSVRQDKIEQTWFARVRTINGFTFSDFSNLLQFLILRKDEVESSENILTNLPDIHVYGKEDLRKPVANRNTNLYLVANMYGKEFDQSFLENTLTKTNNFISLSRDEALFDNFGVFFNYTKPQVQEFVEYRECLRNLILGSLTGGTIDAIERIVKCFTGVTPTLLEIKDRDDFFLTTIGPEVPPETPNGAITFFSISQAFIPGSVVVLQNGTVLTSTVDFNENTLAQGIDFTIAPTGGDIIQIFYQIGFADDPEPLVFDLGDKTTLTGTVTFTNGSKAVTGAGTLFTSELVPGNTITDDQGLVLGVVDTITDDFNLVLNAVWIGNTGANSSAAKLNFGEDDIPPSIAWSQVSLQAGIIIQVNNPGEFALEEDLIETLVGLLMPAHVEFFFEFN